MDQAKPNGDGEVSAKKQLIDEAISSVVEMLRNGQSPRLEDYVARYPECAQTLGEIWTALVLIEGRKSTAHTLSGQILSTSVNSVSVNSVSVNKETQQVESPAPIAADLTGISDAPNQTASESSQAGAYIGRYVILRRLGQGGFGTVLLARDTELDRLVAIKLPHSIRAANTLNQAMYLCEAKTLARLDHPSIVPIYDCGVISDGRCFVVSKYIEGRDMARVLADGPLNAVDIAKLLATVAEALHYVHRLRLIHRDVKPANLLLGADGKIYLADFGLALQEGTASPSDPIAGTPNYMSPEQLRREGHRIDGRSDQFSLGVVMYEFLTGQRPFAAAASHEILRKVVSEEPIPPKQIDPRIPSELDRICLKLLSKLASQRYEETIDLAYDLRDWLKKESVLSSDVSYTDSALPSTRMLAADVFRNEPHAVNVVVPKGLRAYTRSDAYFFLDLLPGTRDRDGLPNVLSHWKRWLSTREDGPELQRVGVISGPTGCGKSSLVRAGLLPILNPELVPIIVEATADLTEHHLSAAIDRHCSDHLEGSLVEVLSQVRLGKGLRPGKTLVLIIDQFEQWLHFHPDPMQTELVQALRQCDGIRIQCLLLIRDDFWLALSRFMEVIESPLQLGRNVTMVDLFDLRHAKKVLIEFGRGYGQLPKSDVPLSRDQERFLDGAIANLTTGGKVIPVHLALFAEMAKNRDWNPTTLRQLGGTVGIGAQFLNESFSAMYAPANQRAHAESARRILQALLPTLGTEIKTGRKTRKELHELSNYGDNIPQFEQLMGILESDLKLISAADMLERTRSEARISAADETSYQLSHDFLVPSIREWINAKQRQSWRGRLQQRLSEQAGLWNLQQDSRFLPSTWEWLQMRCGIPSRTLSAPEKKMMAASDRRSGMALSLGLLSIAVLVVASHQIRSSARIHSLVEQLSTADASRAPQILDELNQYGSKVETGLDRKLSDSESNSTERLVLQLAQLRWNSKSKDDVFQQIVESPRFDFLPLASQSLRPFAKELAPKCWELLRSNASNANSAITIRDQQIRASQLLASFDPPSDSTSTERWQQSAELIADLLVGSCVNHPNQYALLANSMRPVSNQLVEPLSRTLGHETDSSQARFATSLLAEYLKSDSKQLTLRYLDAADWQKPIMAPDEHSLDHGVLWEVVRAQLDYRSESMLVRDARRMAMAASLLLTHSKQEDLSKVLNLLRRSSDPTCRSHLIRLIAQAGVPLDRLSYEVGFQKDNGILAAILIAIGDYSFEKVSGSRDLQRNVAELFRNHPDSGVHSAAEWLLTQWEEFGAIASLPKEATESSRNGPLPPRRWIRTPHGQTMVRVSASDDVNVGRDFLIATTEVTAAQFKQFDPNKYINAEYSPLPECPANVVTWPQAAAYCNWLSEQEGLPLFYPSNADELAKWNATEKQLLGLGYRMPTDAEWVFASNAGSATELHFGSDPELMIRYDWVAENNAAYRTKMGWQVTDPKTGAEIFSSKPVGLLRPNDLGIFDTFGNSAEWCNDGVDLGASFERAIRGFSASVQRAKRPREKGSFQPMVQYNSMGMRVARTLP